MAQELKALQAAPPPGVCAWPVEEKLNELEAQICGPSNTVYEGGVFKLSVHLPDRYPFEPPKCRFLTAVYHPNIDNGGRICLDILNMPPKGAWRPSLNISTVLASIGVLLSEPNPDDGLVPEVTHEYRHDRAAFDAKARNMTRCHAKANEAGSDAAGAAPGAGGDEGGTVGSEEGSQRVGSESETSEDSSSSDSDGEEGVGGNSMKKQRTY